MPSRSTVCALAGPVTARTAKNAHDENSSFFEIAVHLAVASRSNEHDIGPPVTRDGGSFGGYGAVARRGPCNAYRPHNFAASCAARSPTSLNKFVSGCSRPWPYLTLPPFGCTSVATPGVRSCRRPALRMGDLWRQVSWLTARTSLSSLPGAPTRSASGVFGEDLPLTVAGAATVLALVAPHRVPSSSPRACARFDTVTPLNGLRNGTLSTQIRLRAGDRRTC